MATFRNYTTTPRRSDEVHYNPSYAWLGGDYDIRGWHLRADVDREIITLSHPAFHTVRMTGDKAREIFEELDDLYAADDLPAKDVWEHYLSQYIRFTSDSKGVRARGMASRYKSRSKRAQVADSDAGSDKLYTMPFREMDKAFSTGLPNGYKFIGTGVSFLANKRTHTVDFRNTNVSEDEDGAFIAVPYDSNTGTVAQVKQDLATMIAGKSGKVSDAGHCKDTKYQPRRVSDNKVRGMRHGVPSSSKKLVGNRRMQDSNESAAADYSDVFRIFFSEHLYGFVYSKNGLISIDTSTTAARALKLTDLPYDIRVTFEADGAGTDDKWGDRDSVPLSNVNVSLLRRNSSSSGKPSEWLCGWYIPAGQVITQADVTAIATVFKRVVSDAPKTIDAAYSLLRSGLQSFEFRDDSSSRTHGVDGDMSVD